MRTLAIDLGERRVGLALSDEGGRFATPLEVLFVSSSDAAAGPILEFIRTEGVQRIVLGLPLNMDGTIGPAAKRMFQWGQALSRQSGLPVIFVDERLSSFDAEQTLVARKRAGERLTRQRKKERLDALAAASFLQAFLDGKLAPLTLPDNPE
ncbi:MAG: Holliday junction resolvase RuvX [Bacillota bacterium]